MYDINTYVFIRYGYMHAYQSPPKKNTPHGTFDPFKIELWEI